MSISALPQPGELAILNGCSLGIVLESNKPDTFVKVVTVHRSGKREIAYWLTESLGIPDQQRLSSLVKMYDKTADFFDGCALVQGEAKIEGLIEGARGKVFELLCELATTVRQFDSPTNYSRARVLLDFAERTDADSVETEQRRARLTAAKDASRAQFDPSIYYQKLREAGYNPTIHGVEGRVGISVSLSGIRGVLPTDADEVDIDQDLRWDYARALWDRREPGTFVVPLGV